MIEQVIILNSHESYDIGRYMIQVRVVYAYVEEILIIGNDLLLEPALRIYLPQAAAVFLTPVMDRVGKQEITVGQYRKISYIICHGNPTVVCTVKPVYYQRRGLVVKYNQFSG